jgi:hypothetical protein
LNDQISIQQFLADGELRMLFDPHNPALEDPSVRNMLLSFFLTSLLFLLLSYRIVALVTPPSFAVAANKFEKREH